jgi:hypothetical protein
MDIVNWFIDSLTSDRAILVFLCIAGSLVLRGLWWLFTRIEIPGILERDKI